VQTNSTIQCRRKLKVTGEEAFSGVLHKHDLPVVTIAKGSVQGTATPQEAWEYAERW